MHIESMKIDDLTPYEGNPRRGNIDVISNSLQHLGQYRPIVVNTGTHTGRTNEVLAGNHTLEAAKRLGWETIDAVTVDVDDEKAARIVVIDNRSNDLAEYDNEALVEILQSLPDLEATGYDDDDLKSLMDALQHPEEAEWGAAFDAIPDGEKSDHFRRSFILSLEQVSIVDRAIAAAREHVQETVNMNASALTLICERYIRDRT